MTSSLFCSSDQKLQIAKQRERIPEEKDVIFKAVIDGAACVGMWIIEYDPRVINFRQLLEVYWSSHDSRQVFGQSPDVGNQYRSIIFVNGTEESRLAVVSKEREQTKSRGGIVTT